MQFQIHTVERQLAQDIRTIGREFEVASAFQYESAPSGDPFEPGDIRRIEFAEGR